MEPTTVVLILLLVATGLRFAELGDYWCAELVTHFPVQYGMLSLLLSVAFLWNQEVLLCIASIILSIINLSVLVGKKSKPMELPAESFEIYAANVWCSNRFHQRLLEEIQTLRAEIAFISELTPEVAQLLRPRTAQYDFQIEEPRSTPEGFLFLSKFPILSYQIIDMKEHAYKPLLVAELLIHGREVTFYGVHSANPVWIRTFSKRNQQFSWLAQHIAHSSKHVIVAGDFNLTPYSPVFKKLVQAAEIKDSREGFGWQPSWPALVPMFWIPIDHVLLSLRIQVHSRATGPFIGSDHYPVTTRVSLEEASVP